MGNQFMCAIGLEDDVCICEPESIDCPTSDAAIEKEALDILAAETSPTEETPPPKAEPNVNKEKIDVFDYPDETGLHETHKWLHSHIEKTECNGEFTRSVRFPTFEGDIFRKLVRYYFLGEICVHTTVTYIF